MGGILAKGLLSANPANVKNSFKLVMSLGVLFTDLDQRFDSE